MLQKIRKGSRTWVGVAMAVFLMIMFGFIGVNELGGTQGQPTSVVITVGSGEITGERYRSYYQNVIARLSREQNRPISYVEAKREGIVRQVNQALVQQEIYAEALRQLEIMPPRSAVQRQIQQMNPQLLQQQLQQYGGSQSEFINAIRRVVAQRQLVTTVTDVRFIPKSVADRLYRLRNERRAATHISIPLTAVKTVPDPSPSDLQSYYEKNRAKYRLPTYRVVTLLIIRPKDIDEMIKVTGDMIRSTYNQNKSRYSTPERREVHQFIVRDAAVAKKVADALKEGRSFESVAEKIAKQKIDSLGLKPIAEFRAYPVRDLGARVLTLKVGETAGPYKNPLGGQIFIKLADIKKPTIRPLDEVRQQVVELIRQRRRSKVRGDLREKIDDLITEGKSLADIAKQFKLNVLNLESITREGKDANGEAYEKLPGGIANFARILYAQDVGTVSNVFDSRDGGIYVLRVKKEVKAHTPNWRRCVPG